MSSNFAVLEADTKTARVATESDEDFVVSILVMAFSADPAARWLYPDPDQYLTHFPNFVRAFGGKAFSYGSAYEANGAGGAALWLRPGVEPEEEALTNLLKGSADKNIRADVVAMSEEMGRYHPDEPHWYLPLIGIDTVQQGRGYGSELP